MSFPSIPEFPFVCNACGGRSVFQESHYHDCEVSSCSGCGSNVRFRWLIHRLSLELFGRSIPLTEFPHRKSIKGLGLTDPAMIGNVLARQFSYRNTYLTGEPRFDVRCDDSPLGPLDFLIASEVFEHVEPPVSKAFQNAGRILKDSGVFLFTAPWVFEGERATAIGQLHDWNMQKGPNGQEIVNRKPDGTVERIGNLSPDGRPGNSMGYTREHFPELHDWHLATVDDESRLINRRRDGTTEEFHHLTFHGGPGLALEMRLFTKKGIEDNLRAAGFQYVEFESQDCADWGIFFGRAWDRPVVARKQIPAPVQTAWWRRLTKPRPAEL
jgi:hypothetical protein